MFVLILLRSIIGEEVLLAAAIMINSFKVIRTYHSYTRAQSIQRVLGSIPPEVVKKINSLGEPCTPVGHPFKVIHTYHSYTRAQNIQRVLGSIPPEVVKN
jgi:predicted transcriptional regulator